MNKRVIFLDIDGVLNSESYRENSADYYTDFIDESRLPLLEYIVSRTGALIVLTSTWRSFWNEGENQLYPEGEIISRVFRRHNLEIYSKTPDKDNCRESEINMWIASHGVKDYVILDDMDFFDKEENLRRFVKTDDSKEGLDEETTARAIEILLRD